MRTQKIQSLPSDVQETIRRELYASADALDEIFDHHDDNPTNPLESLPNPLTIDPQPHKTPIDSQHRKSVLIQASSVGGGIQRKNRKSSEINLNHPK